MRRIWPTSLSQGRLTRLCCYDLFLSKERTAVPLIHVHYPTGTLATEARNALAEELTHVSASISSFSADRFDIIIRIG